MYEGLEMKHFVQRMLRESQFSMEYTSRANASNSNIS